MIKKQEEPVVNSNTEELVALLQSAISIFKEDRKIAKDNFDALRDQLDNILAQDLEGSEEYKLEKEMNTALKLLFDSGHKLEKVIESITKIIIAAMTNESKERVASKIFGDGTDGKYITKPINITELLDHK